MPLLNPITDHPFKHIIGTSRSPHARALRTSFWEKIKNAFVFFFGSYNNDVPHKFGAIDYFTLCILGTFHILVMDNLSNKKSPHVGISILAGFLFFLVDIPLLIAHLLIAAVLTFNPLTLFVIGIVQLVCDFIARGAQMQKDALNLFVEEECLEENAASKAENFKNARRISLDMALKAQGSTLEDLHTRITEEDNRIKLEFLARTSTSARDRDPSIKKYATFATCYLPVFQDGESTLSAEEAETWKSMLELDPDYLTAKLDERHSELVDLLMKSPSPTV